MFKVNNKNTRTTSLTSFWCFYCQLQTYFAPFSRISIADFEQINIGWESISELLFLCIAGNVCLELFFNDKKKKTNQQTNKQKHVASDRKF